MSIKCPRGYQMINGVCTESVSSLQHISHINPGARLDCEEACEYLTPSNCAHGGGGWNGCGCDCCIGYWQPCFGDWSNTGCQEWVCDCGMCMGDYNACVNSCVQTILHGMGAWYGQESGRGNW